jgi:hypothetical protein
MSNNIHTSDCSTNNKGTPELYGDCDCGIEAKAQRKYATYLCLLCYNQTVRYRNSLRLKLSSIF